MTWAKAVVVRLFIRSTKIKFSAHDRQPASKSGSDDESGTLWPAQTPPRELRKSRSTRKRAERIHYRDSIY